MRNRFTLSLAVILGLQAVALADAIKALEVKVTGHGVAQSQSSDYFIDQLRQQAVLAARKSATDYARRKCNADKLMLLPNSMTFGAPTCTPPERARISCDLEAAGKCVTKSSLKKGKVQVGLYYNPSEAIGSSVSSVQ
jgi:hypothetical protein